MKSNSFLGLAPSGKGSPVSLCGWLAWTVAGLAWQTAVAQGPSVTSDHSAYYPGEPIRVAFANGPGNPLDWVGIYPDGVEPGSGPTSTAWLYVGGTQQGTVGLTEGAVTFANGLNLAGDWKVYLLLNDGYTKLAEAAFKVVDPGAPLVRVSRPVYGLGESITVTFSNGYGNPKDWIGIYAAGQTPGGGIDATLWSYVDGTQTGSTGLANGSVTFATGLATAANYVAYFLFDDLYEILASEAFQVSAAASMPRVVSVNPANNATDGAPVPRYRAVLSHGSTQVDPESVRLRFDGTGVTPQVTAQGENVLVTYQSDTLLDAGSVHKWVLTFADDAATPNQITHEAQFTVVNYLSIELPAPLFFENFDATAEGALPAGWTEMNYTEVLTPDLDPGNLDSGFYAGWTAVNVDRFTGEFIPYSDPDAPQADREDYRRVLTENPRFVVNGQFVSPMARGRMVFANSGYRNGRSQVQFLYSPEFDLSGKTAIHLSFHSLWEQNQDNLAALEFTIDGGQSWLPVVYLLEGADVVRTPENEIDVDATFNTPRGDIAVYYDPNDGVDKGGSYGAFIAAPLTPALAPFIQARVNDDPRESKRVELFRLPQADNQAKVRFRFAHAGADSWYWGIDDFGLYSIPEVTPPTITTQPQSQTRFAGDAATFTVAAGGIGPFTYQWFFNGTPIGGATTATLEIARARSADAGVYLARAANSAGSTDSSPVTLTVQPLPDGVSGVWNFGAEQLGRTSGVGLMEFADLETGSLTAFEQGPPPIGGVNAAFMRVPSFSENGNGYNLTMPSQPVGGEGSINRYSMVWDILLPGDINWMPFFNTAPGNNNDADFYVSASGSLGIGALGYSAVGLVQPDTWYRVVFAANLGSGRVTVYLDGTPVLSRTGGSLAEGRFALYSDLDAGPDVRLFNEGDNSGVYTHEVLVNSFAFMNRELTPEEAAALGGPSVDGISLPAPATPIAVGTPTVAAGTLTFGWTGGTGPFQVQKKSVLSAATWENLGGLTTERTATDAVTGPAAFYRVQGQ